MGDELEKTKNHFIQGLSRISGFWGFPKAMGAMYGVIYLSKDPVGLDVLVQQVGISKGAVSTNARYLERLGMIHKHLKIGDRKDYYTAETDFWKIVKGILKEREKSEFDIALKSIDQSIDILDHSTIDNENKEMADFYKQRLGALKDFFGLLDKIVGAIITLENFSPKFVLDLFKRK